MIWNRQNKTNQIESNRNWKEKNKRYLTQLQKFLDKAESIQDEDLRKDIIGQMLRCDIILTELAEKEFQKYYYKGAKQC